MDTYYATTFVCSHCVQCTLFYILYIPIHVDFEHNVHTHTHKQTHIAITAYALFTKSCYCSEDTHTVGAENILVSFNTSSSSKSKYSNCYYIYKEIYVWYVLHSTSSKFKFCPKLMFHRWC